MKLVYFLSDEKYLDTLSSISQPKLVIVASDELSSIENSIVLDGATGFEVGQYVAQNFPDACFLANKDYEGREALGTFASATKSSFFHDVVSFKNEDAVKLTYEMISGSRKVTISRASDSPKLAAISLQVTETFVLEGEFEAVASDSFSNDFNKTTLVIGKSVSGNTDEVSLESAEVVVSGGRGLGTSEKYQGLIVPLAAELNGATGASRAIVDSDWVSYDKQVGQTGKSVSPKVYFACGISGATQHIVGMKGSKNIIAINTDAEAPIFKICDIGIVGDVEEVIPKLLSAISSS